jgi:hypothetical protein
MMCEKKLFGGGTMLCCAVNFGVEGNFFEKKRNFLSMKEGM